jgi:hypothetical protein
MPAMGRWLMQMGAVLSGMLLLATLAVWPISHYRWLHVEYTLANRHVYQLSAATERVQFTFMRNVAPEPPMGFRFTSDPLDPPEPWKYLQWDTYSSPRFNSMYVMGFKWVHDPAARPYYVMDLAVPCAYLVVLFALLPAWVVWTRRRRPPPGHCRKCGYDLRAHRAGERCPECGTVIAPGQT